MGVRRMLILVGAVSTILLSFTAVAGAQGITGGCTATVNGRSPESMTEDNPLVVSKDEQVSLSGQVPPSVAPAGKQIRSTTDVYVDIFGFPVKIRTATGKGATWGGNVELPKMVRDLATGVYRVSGDATGSPGGWKCSGSAYIKLEGNALTKPATYVGAGVGLAGAGDTDPIGSALPDIDLTWSLLSALLGPLAAAQHDPGLAAAGRQLLETARARGRPVTTETPSAGNAAPVARDEARPDTD